MFLTTAVVTAAAWYAIKREITKRAQQHFDFRVRTIETAVRERLLDYEHMLRGGVALFASSNEVTREEWKTYVGSVQIEQHYPGVQGVGFSKRVLPAEQEAHTRQIRAEGFAGYTIRPEGERPEYTSIVFLEPFDWRNQRAFGYDMFSEPTRRDAMARARDTGLAALSGKVTLVQETDEDVQAGFLLYLPYYRNGGLRQTTEQRREALEGYVYSPFRMDDFMRGILAERGRYVELRIFDGDVASKEALLHDSEAGAERPAQADHSHLLSRRSVLEFQGHRWLLAFSSSLPFEQRIDTWQAHTILVLGFIIALLLFGVVSSLERSRAQALAVAHMAGDLERANAELAERVAERQRATEELQSANRDLGDSRKAALNMLQDAELQRQRLEQAFAQLSRAEETGRRRAERAQGLQQAGQQLAACRTLSEIQHLVAEAPVRFLGARMCSVRLPGPHGTAPPVAFSGQQGEEAVPDCNCARGVFANQAERLVPDTLNAPSFPHCSDGARERGFACCATFPILAGGECVAAVTVCGTEPGPDGDLMQSVPLLRVFATHVGEVWQRCLAMRDLDEARQAAESASLSKSAFVANMSHEIRTPLNAIIGLTYLALKTDLSPRQRDYMGKVQGSSHGLLAVVNDILDFSKIEAGKLQLESVEFEVASVTRHLFDVFGLQAEQKGLQLLFKVDADVPSMLVGDATRLRQVLTNLLGNAIKFTESGQVTLAVRRADGAEAAVSDAHDTPCVTLELSVTDTGVGIPNDKLSSLFQAFSQADTSTTRKFGGTGLGLSITKRLVDMMGGDIQVQSQPAQGSTFSFTAVFGRPERRSGRRLEPRDELRGLRVLVVDDDESSLDTLVRGLKAFGLSPSPVASAREAIVAVSEQPKDAPYELLLADWRLPQMDGLELCDQLRSDGLTATLILMSGYWNHDLATCVDEGRVDAFLLKPFTPSTLFETILQVFADRLLAGSGSLASAATEST
ncbi:MAG: response regulator, partial [Victivallales bacterium]|nr:response regulator [Victivallales bacterium]